MHGSKPFVDVHIDEHFSSTVTVERPGLLPGQVKHDGALCFLGTLEAPDMIGDRLVGTVGEAAISAVLFISLAREAPPTPPCPPEMEGRALMLDGLRSLVKSSPFWLLMAVYLIANSVFNGLSTWIESILRPRGFSPAQAGVAGGLLLLGAILGAFVLPTLSDRARKRKPYLLLGVLGSIPWLLGIILGREYWILLLSAFAFGFLLVGIAPIGYQYAAELTYPVPEGTSNGMLTLAGQVSVVFIFAMEALRAPDGSFTPSFLILAGLMLVNALLITRLKESELIASPVKGDSQPG